MLKGGPTKYCPKANSSQKYTTDRVAVYYIAVQKGRRGDYKELINGVLGSLSTIALLIVCKVLKLHLKGGVPKLSVDNLNCS